MIPSISQDYRFLLSSQHPNCDETGLLQNVMKHFILKMKDKYIKCCKDSTWIDAVDWENERLSQQKICHSHLTNKLNLLRNKLSSAIFALLGESKDYFIKRVNETEKRIHILDKEILDTRLKLYGYLYFPLIGCINDIINYKQHHICSHQNCFFRQFYDQVWDASLLIMYIYRVSKLTILEFDSFSNWDPKSIFAHPIINLIEDRLDIEMSSVYTYMSVNKEKRAKNIASISFRIFYDLEIAYLLSIIKHLYYDYVKYPMRFEPKFYSVMQASGTGSVICSYLIGEFQSFHLFSSMGLISKKRKLN